MILQRYIVRSLVGPFLLGFGIVTFLLTMDMLLDLLDLIIGKGIPVWTVVRLFFLALGWMVALSVPCGVLVAVLMTFGRMSQDNEIVALRASGVHLFRILAPALGTSAIVAIALALFNNYVLPESNYAFSRLRDEMMRKRPTAEIREGVLMDDFRGYHLFISRLNDRTGEMQDVLILDSTSSPTSPRTILAKNGILHFRPEENALTLELFDGQIHQADPNAAEGTYRWLDFGTHVLRIQEVGDLWREGVQKRRGQREMSVEEMKAEIRKLEADRDNTLKYITSDLEKLSLPDLEALDRRDPASAVQVGVGGLWRKALKQTRPSAPSNFSVDEQRTVEAIRSRQGEVRSVERRISEFRVEIHKKFSIPVACVVFVLVGAPLGIRARRGGLAVGFLSSAFFVFYWLCLIGGEQLADRRLLPPWVAMWLANVVLGALGIALTASVIRSGDPGRPRPQKAAP